MLASCSRMHALAHRKKLIVVGTSPQVLSRAHLPPHPSFHPAPDPRSSLATSLQCAPERRVPPLGVPLPQPWPLDGRSLPIGAELPPFQSVAAAPSIDGWPKAVSAALIGGTPAIVWVRDTIQVVRGPRACPLLGTPRLSRPVPGCGLPQSSPRSPLGSAGLFPCRGCIRHRLTYSAAAGRRMTRCHPPNYALTRRLSGSGFPSYLSSVSSAKSSGIRGGVVGPSRWPPRGCETISGWHVIMATFFEYR